MAKLLLSAFTDEYSRDVDTQIRLCREHNISYIEPRFVNDKNIANLSAAEAKELKKKLGDIKVSAIGSPLGKINLADDFDEHLEKAKRVFETANILDTPNVRIFSFYLYPNKIRQECKSEVIEKLGQMIHLAKQYRVILCHENEADIYGETPDNCLDILEVFKGDLRCVFDMGNFVLAGIDPYKDAYSKLKKYIQYFHIKDALAIGAVVPPGCGEGQIADILKEYLSERKKDVMITLEPHLQTFDGLNALANKTFDNPYKYENQEEAFLDALKKIRRIFTGHFNGNKKDLHQL